MIQYKQKSLIPNGIAIKNLNAIAKKVAYASKKENTMDNY